MSTTWDVARKLREQHVTAGPVTNKTCAALAAEIDAWLAVNDRSRPERSWWTAQLEDGRIVGVWATTELEAQMDVEVWWGDAVHWIVRDPGSAVHVRYLTDASSPASRTAAARTFPLTPEPVEFPFRAGEVPSFVPLTLFELAELA